MMKAKNPIPVILCMLLIAAPIALVVMIVNKMDQVPPVLVEQQPAYVSQTTAVPQSLIYETTDIQTKASGTTTTTTTATATTAATAAPVLDSTHAATATSTELTISETEKTETDISLLDNTETIKATDNDFVKTILSAIKAAPGGDLESITSPDRPWRIMTHTGVFTENHSEVGATVRETWKINSDSDWTFRFESALVQCTPEDFGFSMPEDVSIYGQWMKDDPIDGYSSLMIYSKKNGVQIFIYNLTETNISLEIMANNTEEYISWDFEEPIRRGYVVTEYLTEENVSGSTVNYALYEMAYEVALALQDS